MITKIKAVAAALIAIAGIITSNAAQAADRIPDELLGCWKYVEFRPRHPQPKLDLQSGRFRRL